MGGGGFLMDRGLLVIVAAGTVSDGITSLATIVEAG
jgi:hypothetical protein